MTYGFILHFRIQEELNSAYELLKVKPSSFTLTKFFNPANIRAIRKINPEVKIIAVSGLTEKDKLKNVADYTNAFLPKPYTAERLLKTIHDVLSNH